MPGRIAQVFTWQTLYEQYQLKAPLPGQALRLRYNIAPTQQAIVISVNPQTGDREAGYRYWGLISNKTNPHGEKPGLINARRDTVARLPSFHEPFKERRCIVPTTGVYEWKVVAGEKQPYFIARNDGLPISFAGLWEYWTPLGGEPKPTFAIIATEPNKLIAPLHHRMGAALNSDEVATWLDPKTSTGSYKLFCYRARGMAYTTNPSIRS